MTCSHVMWFPLSATTPSLACQFGRVANRTVMRKFSIKFAKFVTCDDSRGGQRPPQGARFIPLTRKLNKQAINAAC
jgi:hypothetical protein